ncbi:MAG: DUF6263 family protein [Ferruginibacter sp.]
MTFTKSPSLLFAIFSIFTMTTSAQTATGKLLLTKGQKILIDNDIKTVSNQQMMGQSMEITSDAKTVHKVEVKEKKSNSYLISTTLTKVLTSGSAMGQEMKFDSDKKEDLESETGKAFKDQLNVSMDAEFNENAQVINAVKKDTAASGGNPMMDMMKKFAGASGTELNGASAAFTIIPSGKKVGDTWSDSSITDAAKIYTTYTFKALDGKNATIVSTGKQLIKMKVEQQGMEINLTMDGILSSEGIIDISTGLIKQKTTTLNATSTTEVMGQSIPGTTKVTTVTSVKTI